MLVPGSVLKSRVGAKWEGAVVCSSEQLSRKEDLAPRETPRDSSMATALARCRHRDRYRSLVVHKLGTGAGL